MTLTHSSDAPVASTPTGSSLLAGQAVRGAAGTLRAVDPATGESTGPEYGLLEPTAVQRATTAAAEAFTVYRDLSPTERAAFLRRAADEIDALGEALTAVATAETGLPAARISGERARTVGQLRMFADMVEQGDHLQVRIDTALPDREPLPRPDLRQLHVPLGPVAVFGASNFPLAFSVAGGDTASALAAGCPVVVKAHSAHPQTGELVGQALTRAVAASGLPGGVFSLLYGAGSDIGQALVADPRITAVGFTGSRSGGLALVATAQARPVPIPVYAEMSAVNPVVLTPGALSDPAGLAAGYVGSLTLGAGQFCTNPGLILVPTSAAGDAFVAAAAEAVAAATGQTMLTAGIRRARLAAADAVAGSAAVRVLATGTDGGGPNAPAPALLETDVAAFTTEADLSQEVFGAVGLVVRYRDAADLRTALTALEGQLTATVHSGPGDTELVAGILPLLTDRAGRVLFGGWPTGVEVSPAMVHGGPFPATSDVRSTSVGTLAVQRFLRPICYQSAPPDLLPPALRDENPWGLTRRVDGVLQHPGPQGDPR